MSTKFYRKCPLNSTVTIYRVLPQLSTKFYCNPRTLTSASQSRFSIPGIENRYWLAYHQRLSGPHKMPIYFLFFSFFPFAQYLNKIAFYKIWFRDIYQYLYVNSNPQKKSCQCRNYITWPSRGAAALAWRGALSSSPSFIHKEIKHINKHHCNLLEQQLLVSYPV